MSEGITLFTVSPTHIDRAWREGAHKLGEALKLAAGECTESQLKYRLARGELTLLAIQGEATAWIAVEFLQMPNMRALHVYAIYAPGATIGPAFDRLADYARQGGASVLQGACTRAVARLWGQKFGFEEVYTIARKSL